MKKLLKRIIGTICALSILFTLDAYAYAANDNKVSQRKEVRGQIDFNDINVAVINKNKLSYSPKIKNGKATNKGEGEVAELNELIAEVPEIEDFIVKNINNNMNFVAMGYTTLYLTTNDEGEYIPYVEPVATSSLLTSTAYAGTGAPSVKGTCTSTTSVYRSDYMTSGKWTYTTYSNIIWSYPGIHYIGGENHHGSGNDYLLQSCPNTFQGTSDFMNTRYWETHDSGAIWNDMDGSRYYGNWYWRMNGGSNYIQWAVKDETDFFLPFDCTALQSATLWQNSLGPAPKTGEVRRINSYYIHTWDTLNISVNIVVSTSKEVALEITPSKQSNQWPLYSYVTFTN